MRLYGVGVLTLLGLLVLSASAAEKGFAGKWRGEIPAAAPAAPGARGIPANQYAQFGQRGGGGGFGPQKVTLNLKTKDKDTKASGNITVGTANPEDVRDGVIWKNILTFSTGRAPGLVYQYRGELNGDEITMTRSSGSGDRAVTVKFVLKRD